jgi:hypothetical protein
MEGYYVYIQGKKTIAESKFFFNNYDIINAVLDVISYYHFSMSFLLLFVCFPYVPVLSL